MENIKIDKERAWIFAVSTEYLLKDEIDEYFAPAEPPIRFIAPPVRVMDPLKSQFT